MARRLFWTAVLALVLGTAAAAADSALSGEWVSDEMELRFDDGNVEIWFGDSPIMRGTYTAMNGTITIKIDYLHGIMLNDLAFSPFITLDSRWYSQNEFRESVFPALAEVFLSDDLPYTVDDMIAELEETMGMGIDKMLDEAFTVFEMTYSLSGNTLILVVDDGPDEVYTRR